MPAVSVRFICRKHEAKMVGASVPRCSCRWRASSATSKLLHSKLRIGHAYCISRSKSYRSTKAFQRGRCLLKTFVIASLSSFTTSSTQRSDGFRMRSTSCLMSDSNAASDVKRPVRMPGALMIVSRICARSSSSLPFSLRALYRDTVYAEAKRGSKNLGRTNISGHCISNLQSPLLRRSRCLINF